MPPEREADGVVSEQQPHQWSGGAVLGVAVHLERIATTRAIGRVAFLPSCAYPSEEGSFISGENDEARVRATEAVFVMIEEFGGVSRSGSGASILDDKTREQAEQTALLPILTEPIALMADAHLDYGATIGSVIPTESAVIPSGAGVDIGCGMAGRKVDLARMRAIEHAERWVRNSIWRHNSVDYPHDTPTKDRAILGVLRASCFPSEVREPRRTRHRSVGGVTR